MNKPIKATVRFGILAVNQLEMNVNGMINKEGAVKISLIITGLASGKFAAINPRAGEIAAPAITVAIEMEMIVGFNMRFIGHPPVLDDV